MSPQETKTMSNCRTFKILNCIFVQCMLCGFEGSTIIIIDDTTSQLDYKISVRKQAGSMSIVRILASIGSRCRIVLGFILLMTYLTVYVSVMRSSTFQEALPGERFLRNDLEKAEICEGSSDLRLDDILRRAMTSSDDTDDRKQEQQRNREQRQRDVNNCTRGKDDKDKAKPLREFLFKVLRDYKQSSRSMTNSHVTIGKLVASDNHDTGQLQLTSFDHDNEHQHRVIAFLQEYVFKFAATREISKFIKQANIGLNLYANDSSRDLSILKRFHNIITPFSLYSRSDSGLIDELLNSLSSSPFKSVDDLSQKGSQVKYGYSYKDGSKALFKPKRMQRDFEEPMDEFYFYEKERHTAEIAAFHLDRLLDFRSVPPVAGRTINLVTEFKKLLHERKETFFYTSPAGNLCFTSKCKYFCGQMFGVCGVGESIEGSFAAYYPPSKLSPQTQMTNPWKRSYSRVRKAEWEETENGADYCAIVRQTPPYDKDTPLLNVIDAHIFDFMTGNKDRHHLYTFQQFGNGSFLILWDNGKGFGRAKYDILDLLAPLYQCCMVRFTTLRTLLEFHTSDQKLSDRMRSSLAEEALPGILTEAHLKALDRRVRIILKQIHNCTRNKSIDEVVIDDQYFLERG